MSIIYHHSGMSRIHDRAQTVKYRGTDILSALLRWQARIRQRHDLKQLDARLLEDVGLTAAQRAGEIRKPFWKP